MFASVLLPKRSGFFNEFLTLSASQLDVFERRLLGSGEVCECAKGARTFLARRITDTRRL